MRPVQDCTPLQTVVAGELFAPYGILAILKTGIGSGIQPFAWRLTAGATDPRPGPDGPATCCPIPPATPDQLPRPEFRRRTPPGPARGRAPTGRPASACCALRPGERPIMIFDEQGLLRWPGGGPSLRPRHNECRQRGHGIPELISSCFLVRIPHGAHVNDQRPAPNFAIPKAAALRILSSESLSLRRIS